MTSCDEYKKYSCNTADETLEWINAIIDFLKPYKSLMDAHVANFLKDKLWESIDQEWMDTLCSESVENLLKLHSGLVQDHWPASLKEFILTLRSLVLPRDQGEIQTILPDFNMTCIGNVLAQGMNMKKKHEVEILAAIVHAVAKTVGAEIVVDVGAGQGYLAQVLTFQCELSVVAIDASSHHGTVTSARAARILKHYAAKMRKSQTKTKELNTPQTVAVHVLSSDMLKALSDSIAHKDTVEQPNKITRSSNEHALEGLQYVGTRSSSCNNTYSTSSLVLAGLHACGDLSVNMLRTFLECEEVKAVISIGCCYNLLSEESSENGNTHCGFPLSSGVNSTGFSLGRSARDLGCQSADRWSVLSKDAALDNFKLHAFRAAFQMVLYIYFPDVLTRSSSIGRQGKALRRQQAMKALENHLTSEESNNGHKLSSHECCGTQKSCSTEKLVEVVTVQEQIKHAVPRDEKTSSSGSKQNRYPDGASLFEKFCESGLKRLGLVTCKNGDIVETWRQTELILEYIGPYWTLRACLGPVVETLLLLDRLLFLQEQGGDSMKAVMLPIFDPLLSPRNVAIIAQKI